MPEPFQPTVTRWVLDGRRVRAGTPGAEKVTEKSPTWWGKWKDPVTGELVKRPLGANKDKARRKLNEILGKNERVRLGLDPVPEPAEETPLAELVEGYARHLEAKGDGKEHCERSPRRVRRMLGLLGWKRPADVKRAGVLEAAAGLRAGGAAELPAGQPEFTTKEVADLLKIKPESVRRIVKRAGLAEGTKADHTYLYPRADVAALLGQRGWGVNTTTSNHYLTALKSFTAWLEESGKIIRDPLRRLKLPRAEADRRRRRRALEPDLFARFVDGVAAGPAFGALAGPDRLIIYTLAANTGLRAQELGTLTPERFRLAAGREAVLVPARLSKSRKQVWQPLRADVAEMMRQYLAGRPQDAPLWPGRWWRQAAQMIRQDLERAGIPYLEAERYFDFHSLRGQFATLLAHAGVHPRVAQALLRHSTIQLTMEIYTDEAALDVAGALDLLPPLPPSAPGQPAGPPPAG